MAGSAVCQPVWQSDMKRCDRCGSVMNSHNMLLHVGSKRCKPGRPDLTATRIFKNQKNIDKRKARSIQQSEKESANGEESGTLRGDASLDTDTPAGLSDSLFAEMENGSATMPVESPAWSSSSDASEAMKKAQPHAEQERKLAEERQALEEARIELEEARVRAQKEQTMAEALAKMVAEVREQAATEKRKREEAEGQVTLCTICHDKRATYAAVACGHLLFCLDCKDEGLDGVKGKCPFCRRDLPALLKVVLG
mmetsp:Transcript_81111/g.143025  ORF Transcript_81111/g.143025 Transcript_81111/m.143025 type:complete len:253 (-) Transcript_81111:107-865(-)